MPLFIVTFMELFVSPMLHTPNLFNSNMSSEWPLISALFYRLGNKDTSWLNSKYSVEKVWLLPLKMITRAHILSSPPPSLRPSVSGDYGGVSFSSLYTSSLVSKSYEDPHQPVDSAGFCWIGWGSRMWDHKQMTLIGLLICIVRLLSSVHEESRLWKSRWGRQLSGVSMKLPGVESRWAYGRDDLKSPISTAFLSNSQACSTTLWVILFSGAEGVEGLSLD